MSKNEFINTLNVSGYVTNKKARELYIDKINNKDKYDQDDIIHAYRWFQDAVEKIQWQNYKRQCGRLTNGFQSKRFKQSSRMGSDHYYGSYE